MIFNTDPPFKRLDHYKLHEYTRKWNFSSANKEPVTMTLTTSIDAMFKRKRGRPPKNRVIEVRIFSIYSVFHFILYQFCFLYYLKIWTFFFYLIWYSPYCTSVQTESLKRIFKSYEVNAGKTLTLHKCDISLLSPLEHSILYDLCPSFCSFPLHFCSSPHSSGLEWQCKQNIYIFFF